MGYSWDEFKKDAKKTTKKGVTIVKDTASGVKKDVGILTDGDWNKDDLGAGLRTAMLVPGLAGGVGVAAAAHQGKKALDGANLDAKGLKEQAGFADTAKEAATKKVAEAAADATVDGATQQTAASIENANAAYSTAQVNAEAGLQYAQNAYSNLETSTNAQIQALNAQAAGFAADKKRVQDQINSYLVSAGGKIDKKEGQYEAAYAQTQKQNAEITKQLEGAYADVKNLKPDEKFYADYATKLSTLEQNLVNDPYSKELEMLYSGGKPSAAELLLKKAQEEAMNQQLSMTASARGGVNYAALARTASNNIVTQNQKAGQDAAILRAQEQERMLGMMLENQRSKQNQQMQLAQMGLASEGQQQGAQMQWASAVQGAVGQNANWAGALANQANQYAATGMGFLNARNDLQGMTMQGNELGMRYDQMGLDVSGMTMNASNNLASAGMNIGNMRTNNALGMGNMGINVANTAMTGSMNVAGLNMDQQRMALESIRADQEQRRALALGLVSAGGSAIGMAL